MAYPQMHMATTLEVYEYIPPGTYVIPVAPPRTVPMPIPFSQNYVYVPCFVAPPNPPPTYVVNPFGIVHYLSDLQNHMALPYGNNLSAGAIYTVLEHEHDDNDNGDENEKHNQHYMNQDDDSGVYSSECTIDLDDDPDRTESADDVHLFEPREGEATPYMHHFNDENRHDILNEATPVPNESVAVHAPYETPSNNMGGRCTQHPKLPQSDAYTRSVHKRKRSTPKRRRHVYRAAQGYLVEEPSDEDDDVKDESCAKLPEQAIKSE